MHDGLLGVPSSAAAHWPGQERGPAALRRAGLVEALRAGGVRVTDHGDLPVVRRRPDPSQRNPHARDRVLAVLRAAADGVRGLADLAGIRAGAAQAGVLEAVEGSAVRGQDP